MISGSTGSGPQGPAASIWSRWRDSLGEAHLTLDAMVAHIDGELAPGPAQRAAEHVQRCLPCAAEVAAHRRTRGHLRCADTPGAPSTLLSALRAIPDEPAPPPSPAGLGNGPAPTAGEGAEGTAARDTDDGTDRDARGSTVTRTRRGGGRGLRRGLPVAVASGIALGSVALAGVPALPMTTPIARSVGPGAVAGVSTTTRAVPGAAFSFASRPIATTTPAVPPPAASVTTTTVPPGPPGAPADPPAGRSR